MFRLSIPGSRITVDIRKSVSPSVRQPGDSIDASAAASPVRQGHYRRKQGARTTITVSGIDDYLLVSMVLAKRLCHMTSKEIS
jgi:hypothetical protein